MSGRSVTDPQAEYVTDKEVGDALEMLGKGYEHRVKDESNDKKYFIITPRIVKAFCRNPYDLALWDTIKDVAGESGECYLNTEQLAILSGMSMGKASDSRKYWIEIGFLEGEIRKDPGYPQPVWHLTVPDLWQQNIRWCEEHPKIIDRVEFMVAQKSLHQVKPSPGEEGVSPREERPSPHETKKNNKEEEKEEQALPLDWKIATDQPITESDLQDAKLQAEAPRMFEKVFGFGKLPWSSTREWERFEKFIVEIYARDRWAFGNYVLWRANEGKYSGLSNKQIRQSPQIFIDTGWPEFEKTQKQKSPEKPREKSELQKYLEEHPQ